MNTQASTIFTKREPPARALSSTTVSARTTLWLATSVIAAEILVASLLQTLPPGLIAAFNEVGEALGNSF